MPALIRELAIAGSRKSDGTANASGKVFLYEPGTTTLRPGYTDDTLSTAWTTSGGGIPLDAGGRVAIWINEMVDVVVADSSGTTVNTFVGYNKTRAEQVEVENDNYLGALTDSSGATSNALGGKTNLDDILTRAAGSLGPDFKYLESANATSRPYIEVIGDIHVSVKDFQAVGNGVADDTPAIQLAANRAKARGGGVVYWPPGTYIVSTVALASATGVSFRGAGEKASIIKSSSTTANVMELTSCTGFSIEGIKITAAATNAASAIVLTGCTYATLRNVLIDDSGGGSFLIPLIAASSSANLRFDGCDIYGKQNDANGRSIRLTDTTDVVMVGGYLRENAGAAVEFAGATGRVTMLGVRAKAGALGSPKGLLWNANCTGQDFTVIGCPSFREALGAYVTPFDMSALATDVRFFQYANQVDGYQEDVASGGTVTPNRTRGTDIRYRGTTTGVAYTVNAPVPTPVAGATAGMRDTLLRLTFHNNAGGAVTGWNLNAAFHRGPAGAPAAIDTTDTYVTVITFQWDARDSVWREISRVVTT